MLSVKLARKILLYQLKDGETYRLRFGIKAVTYECLTDLGSVPPRTVFYDTVKIAPKEHFVSWINTNNEIVRMIINLKYKTVNYNYMNKGIRHFSSGKIIFFGLPANANESTILKVLKRIRFRKDANGIYKSDVANY